MVSEYTVTTISVEDLYDVPDVLLITELLDNFVRILDQAAEVRRQVGEELQPRQGLKFVAAQRSFQRHRRSTRRSSLSNSGCQMTVLQERIKFSAQQLLQIGLRYRGIPHNDGVGGKIAQTLRSSAYQACYATHHVQHRQRVHHAQQIPHGHLAEFQTQGLLIHHTQAQDSLA